MSEFAQLTKLCLGLGAAPAQAEAMARQLMKRADQLVVARGQSREEVMAYLLRLVVQGRHGDVPKEFQSLETTDPNQNNADRSSK